MKRDAVYESELGGMKNDLGKPPLALVPTIVQRGMALIFAYGARKYRRWNWSLGMPLSQSISAAQRHILDFLDGADLDHESGLHNLDHAITMLAIARDNYAHRGAEVDDRRHTFSEEQLQMPIEQTFDESVKKVILEQINPSRYGVGAKKGRR